MNPPLRFFRLLFPTPGRLLLLLLLAGGDLAHATRDLIIAQPVTNNVLRFDGITGAAKGAFIAAGAGGLVSPAQMILGPDGKLYIADSTANVVKRFDLDGNFIDDFTPTGHLSGPLSLKFGPDGNLYVLCGGTTRQIHRFDGSTGAHLELVVNTIATRMSSQSDFTFMPTTSDFLVINSGSLNRVTRFNFSGGAFVSNYINSSGSSAILNSPTSIIIGPDGNYWISSSNGTNKITRFSITNGAKINDPFLGVSATAGHHEQQYENGLLCVANGSGNNVVAYDASAYEPAFSAAKLKTDQSNAIAPPEMGNLNVQASLSTGDGFEFVLAGSQGLTNPKNMLFIDFNDPPTANAGAVSIVPGGELFVLDPSNSSDPEGVQLVAGWLQLSGPSPTPSSPPWPGPANPASNLPVTGLIAPYMPAQMIFRLNVTDGVKTAFDSVTVTIGGFIDNDNDGMPDRWEDKYHLDSLTNDANADKDGDGSLNISEFLAGTNPTSNSDYLRVVHHYQVLPSGFSMRFTSVTGRHYEIQYSSDLVNWAVVPGLEDVLASTESDETTSVVTQPQPQSRFYRVAVKPVGF